jgi:hypothetical protein
VLLSLHYNDLKKTLQSPQIMSNIDHVLASTTFDNFAHRELMLPHLAEEQKAAAELSSQ